MMEVSSILDMSLFVASTIMYHFVLAKYSRWKRKTCFGSFAHLSCLDPLVFGSIFIWSAVRESFSSRRSSSADVAVTTDRGRSSRRRRPNSASPGTAPPTAWPTPRSTGWIRSRRSRSEHLWAWTGGWRPGSMRCRRPWWQCSTSKSAPGSGMSTKAPSTVRCPRAGCEFPRVWGISDSYTAEERKNAGNFIFISVGTTRGQGIIRVVVVATFFWRSHF